MDIKAMSKRMTELLVMRVKGDLSCEEERIELHAKMVAERDRLKAEKKAKKEKKLVKKVVKEEPKEEVVEEKEEKAE